MIADVRFVCGAAEDADLWSEVVTPEAVIDVLPAQASIADLTSEIGSRLKDRPTILVGHSLGAAVALNAAAIRGPQIAGLVLVACGERLPVHPLIWSTLENDGEKAVIERFARLSAPRTERDGEPTPIAVRMGAMMTRAPRGTLTAHLNACAEFQAVPVGCPTIVIAGGADRIVAPDLPRRLAQLTGARLSLIEGVGHQLPWERPQAIREALDLIRAKARL